jgi:hypothetical protein
VRSGGRDFREITTRNAISRGGTPNFAGKRD